MNANQMSSIKEELKLYKKALDIACEILANVETDGCYYCPYDLDNVNKLCELKCNDKEVVKKYLLKKSEKE